MHKTQLRRVRSWQPAMAREAEEAEEYGMGGCDLGPGPFITPFWSGSPRPRMRLSGHEVCATVSDWHASFGTSEEKFGQWLASEGGVLVSTVTTSTSVLLNSSERGGGGGGGPVVFPFVYSPMYAQALALESEGHLVLTCDTRSFKELFGSPTVPVPDPTPLPEPTPLFAGGLSFAAPDSYVLEAGESA